MSHAATRADWETYARSNLIESRCHQYGIASWIEWGLHGMGVEITRVEIQNLEPSRDIIQAMETQMASERQKRATILKSEGNARRNSTRRRPEPTLSSQRPGLGANQ